MIKSEFESLYEWPGLRSLFDLAWRLFSVNLAMVSPDGERAVCYDASNRESPFCHALHSHSQGRKLCVECDRRFFRQALLDPKPLRYKCHAGLTEFIVPIIRQGKVIALLQCGQVLDDKLEDANWPKRLEPEARRILDPIMLETFLKDSRILPLQRQDDLLLFLNLVAGYLANTECPYLQTSSSWPKTIIGRVMTYVEQHLTEDLTLDQIARAVGLSSRSLSRWFKKETGMTVLQFIIKRRVALACHYLAGSDRTCVEIAFGVGFQSIQNFNRCFRRLKGTNPRQWRLDQPKEVNDHGPTVAAGPATVINSGL